MSEKMYTPEEVRDVQSRAYRRGNTEGYDKGWTGGYNEGYSNGKTDGYAEGREDGYTEGYNICYEEGSTKACTLLDPRPVTEHNTESTITITIST